MSLLPGIYSRPDSSIYWYELRVPTDLAHHFKGKRHAVRESLKTRDRREANAKAAALRAECEARFAALRKSDNPERVTPTPALVATIANEVRRWVLQADDNARAFQNFPRALLAAEHLKRLDQLAGTPEGELLAAALPMRSALTLGGPLHETPPHDPLAGLSEREAAALARWNAAGFASTAVDVARQNLRAVLPLAEAIVKPMGLAVDWHSPEGVAGLRELLKAYRLATEDASRRDHGELIDTPPEHRQQGHQKAAMGPTEGKARHTYMDAFDAWQRSKPGRPPKTVAKFKKAAERLAELTGGEALEDLTREAATDIRNTLLAEAQERGGGIANNTAINMFSTMKTLINAAVEVGWLDRSPMPKRTADRVKSGRKPWTRADLSKLFDDPLFASYALPPTSAAGMDAAYWLPLLGAYTGARISELAQLGTKDMERTEEAGWVLHITEDADEGQKVKNTHSVRTVPIHPELVRLGFVDYWQAISDHGPGPLWPALPRSKQNGAGGKISQWFGQFKKAKGFGGELVFHSFRHTVETELRALKAPKYLIDGITGHAGKTVSDDYAHTTPATLREVLDMLTYQGLNLPRVFKVPAWQPGHGNTKVETRGRPKRKATSGA